MTPAQQTALEGLVGRSLTAEEVTAIDAHLPNRRDDLIAQVLSAGRTVVADYWLTDRGLVSDLVRATGNTDLSDAILTKLDAMATQSRSTKAMLNRLENDVRGVNFGDAALLVQWGHLEAVGALTSAEASALRALPVVPNPIAVGQVSDALNVAEGRLTLGGI